MMSRNKTLAVGSVSLNLSGNDLGPKGALQLSRFFPQSHFLKSIDLSNNKIPAKALSEVRLLATLKGTRYNLQSLNQD